MHVSHSSQILLGCSQLFYSHQHALHHVEHVQGRVQSLKPRSSNQTGRRRAVRVNLKQRLTSMWDSDVMLGNFSSPTVTESSESSVEEHVRTLSAEFPSSVATEAGAILTLSDALLGFHGVVQLHLVVSS